MRELQFSVQDSDKLPRNWKPAASGHCAMSPETGAGWLLAHCNLPLSARPRRAMVLHCYNFLLNMAKNY